jgi:hypothetical protein
MFKAPRVMNQTRYVGIVIHFREDKNQLYIQIELIL